MAERILGLLHVPDSGHDSRSTKQLLGRLPLQWIGQAAEDSGVFAQVDVLAPTPDVLGSLEGAGVSRTLRVAVGTTADEIATDAAANGDWESVCVIHGTSLLLKPEHFRRALSLFQSQEADLLVTATREEAPAWDDAGRPVSDKPVWREVDGFRFYRCGEDGTIPPAEEREVAIFEVPPHVAVATMPDLPQALTESLFQAYGHRSPMAPIRLFVIDIDGVMTNGGFYYTEEGEFVKRFHTRDGEGLKRLMKAGIDVGIITGEKTGFTTARAKKLGITRIALGIRDKIAVLDEWREELGIDWDHIAYIGDDLTDVPCIQRVGAGAAPADAEPEAIAAAAFRCTRPGGGGCVREFIRNLFLTGRIHGGEDVYPGVSPIDPERTSE